MNDTPITDNEELAAVTPPPFHPDEAPACPTLADKMAALNLDEGTAARVSGYLAGLDPEGLTDALIAAVARGITHDEDVQNADAAGYLRGRNEKIEAVLRPQPDEPTATVAVFPQYRKRSVWD